jgi:glutamate-5-semialdehyde dehydrogenase
VADALRDRSAEILAANEGDVHAARDDGATQPVLNAIRIGSHTIDDLAKSMQVLAGIGDPVGRVDATWIRPNGLKIEKVRVPIGVIAVVSEGAPAIAPEAAGICLKAGNALILHDSGLCRRTQAAFVSVMQGAAADADIPVSAVQDLHSEAARSLEALIGSPGLVEVVIPRGEASFVSHVSRLSAVPVLKQREGVCHMYVDEDADPELAVKLAEDACCAERGAADCVNVVLVHSAAVDTVAPRMAEALHKCGVEVRGDDQVRRCVSGLTPASEADWRAAAPPGVLTIGAIAGLEDAVAWINEHGAGYCDSIITRNRGTGSKFCQSVDSACVYVNASTRFTDGTQFGMGGQIGFSTGRLHARGPLGTEELTTYKYVAVGNGQTRR